MAVKKKKIKTGGMTLEEAKRKINDPNYNVMSGRIEKDKNVQTGPNKRRITKEDMMNIGMGVLPFSRKPKFLSQLPRVLKPSQRFQRLVTNTQRTKTQPLPKPRPKSLRSTAVTKPRATQLKKPSTAVTPRSNVSRMSPTNAKRFQQMINRAVLTSGVSELVKPKKSVAATKPKTKKSKGVVTGPELDLPKKKKTPKVAPKKAPVKKKRSNIVGSSTYDAQFTYDNLVKRGGKKFAKARMSPENYAKVKKLSVGDKVGLKDLPPKSINPGIHKLPAKAKMNMGFKPMFGGGLIASFYDKPEKIEKYKGNTTSARQVKGYGKAKKKA